MALLLAVIGALLLFVGLPLLIARRLSRVSPPHRRRRWYGRRRDPGE